MSFFQKNLCGLDRVIRGFIGLALLAYAVFGSEHIGDPMLQGIVALFAILNLLSLLIGWCPIYSIAGIKTCKTEK